MVLNSSSSHRSERTGSDGSESKLTAHYDTFGHLTVKCSASGSQCKMYQRRPDQLISNH